METYGKMSRIPAWLAFQSTFQHQVEGIYLQLEIQVHHYGTGQYAEGSSHSQMALQGQAITLCQQKNKNTNEYYCKNLDVGQLYLHSVTG